MKIKEVSEKYSLPVSTLRYYEEIGLIEPVNRVNGIRDYREDDLHRIEFIICLKDGGLPLEVVKEYFDLYRRGDETLELREALLMKQHNYLMEQRSKLQKSLDYIDFKIHMTREKIQKREQVQCYVQ
ncbi:MerR family transcriptional regulator [Bacillus sp. AGMB 02131]|uniref:MerR family transcriptional regulator n=1 Tax=Peribacillus faecalis TaxID=2772559 RepID=A0A927HCK1_9BACI|nr:MerR family transcriptional regulator [Peribacillus faecalis]MBD3110124.1 MerR family transcriptional regulator [Peribacillus faecalis]